MCFFISAIFSEYLPPIQELMNNFSVLTLFFPPLLYLVTPLNNVKGVTYLSSCISNLSPRNHGRRGSSFDYTASALCASFSLRFSLFCSNNSALFSFVLRIQIIVNKIPTAVVIRSTVKKIR